MFTFSSKDKADIESFPLLWRWNQSGHAILSAEEISLIEPLSKSKSRELHELLMLKREKLPERSSKSINSESSVVNTWLKKHLLGDEFLFLSWDSLTAIRVPTSLFVIKNDEFCYPSSDDVFIYPESESYLLQFHHFEVFTWDQLNEI